jgi:hypothetical protein
MRQEFKYSIPIVVLLALIFAIASDYCRPIPLPEKIVTIEIPQPFNPICYVASFKPESPEFSSTTTTTSVSVSSSAVVGTATTTTTTL